ncbi:unnamed protein product, partial [Closterium sp. Naga37s-1]
QFLQDCQTAWDELLPGWGGAHPDCSSAQGITCDSNGMILEMSLPELSLSGSIPDSISALRELSLLYLIKNWCTATIPTTIGVLTNLQQL